MFPRSRSSLPHSVGGVTKFNMSLVAISIALSVALLPLAAMDLEVCFVYSLFKLSLNLTVQAFNKT